MGRILVTGGTGMIGRAMTARLGAAGWRVRLAYRGATPPLAEDLIAVGDLAERPDWTKAVEGVDAIIHLAARVHLPNTASDEWLYRRVNVEAVGDLATAAVRAGVRRLVFLSSIAAVGGCSSTPLSEAVAPAPDGAYGRSKLAAETLLAEQSARTGLGVTVIRAPMVYGPKDPGNFGRLTTLVRRGIPLPFGSIENQRSVLAVDNLVDVMLEALTPAGGGMRVYHVADALPVSTPELVREIAAALRRPARLVACPVPLLRTVGAVLGRKTEIAKLTASLLVDTSRARLELGWAPRLDLATGVAVALAAAPHS